MFSKEFFTSFITDQIQLNLHITNYMTTQFPCYYVTYTAEFYNSLDMQYKILIPVKNYKLYGVPK